MYVWPSQFTTLSLSTRIFVCTQSQNNRNSVISGESTFVPRDRLIGKSNLNMCLWFSWLNVSHDHAQLAASCALTHQSIAGNERKFPWNYGISVVLTLSTNENSGGQREGCELWGSNVHTYVLVHEKWCRWNGSSSVSSLSWRHQIVMCSILKEWTIWL